MMIWRLLASVLMVTLSEILRMQDSGMLVVLGSVAGDRGKASNYLYGAAKAGLATVQQGVIARLHGTGAKAPRSVSAPVAPVRAEPR